MSPGFDFAAALIAGGRSRRMGRDKAFLDWHGRPLWRVQMEKLAALRPARLFIAAREEQDFAVGLAVTATEATIERVNDPADEDRGPMAAIARCLARSPLPLLVLAVDMPLMTAAFLSERLLANARRDAGVLSRGTGAFEPLAAVYSPRALTFFEAALESGAYALQPLAGRLIAARAACVLSLSPEEERLFANANSPHEADRLLRFQNETGCA